MRCILAVMAMTEAGVAVSTAGACGASAPTREQRGDRLATVRAEMVSAQIASRGVLDGRVLAAMRKVPRHDFVPSELAGRAYEDRPLPIGWRQTISQPYIVALMSELAAARPGARVLEVGTGSGYQAAVLSELGAEVYTIEIVVPLARQAAATLARLGYASVHTRTGDGYHGWSEAAPFDAIVVTAAPPSVPEPLRLQLKVGGRLVAPIGTDEQELLVITRTPHGWDERTVIPVVFVPMTGEAQTARPGAVGVPQQPAP